MTIDYHTAAEVTVFRAINADGGRLLDLLFLGLSSKAFGMVAGAAVVALIASCARQRRLPLLVAFALAMVLSDTVGAQVLRPLFGRTRPCFALPPGEFRFLGPASDVGSLPSLHASNFFAMAWVSFAANRRAGLLAFAVASLVALSRIYLGVHWPTDVLAGLAWGTACACTALGFARRVLWGRAGRAPDRMDGLPRG